MKRFFLTMVIFFLVPSVGFCAKAPMYLVQGPNGTVQQMMGTPPPQQAQQQANAAPQPPAAPYVAPRPNTSPELRGCIKVKGSVDKVPQIRILFEGRETVSNSEGFFSFPVDEQNIEKYSFVICKRIKQNFDKTNTLKHISALGNKEYRYYSFKKGTGGFGGWLQRRKNLNTKKFVLPQRSVIILLDPEHVESVETWNVELSNNILKLPMIVIKNDESLKKLQRRSAKSLLYSLDTRPFHESIKEAVKKPADKVAVALAQ